MSIESATYLSQLNKLLPLSGDYIQEGDNHIRLIKSALTTTFHDLRGIVSASSGELNYLLGTTANVQTQLNALSNRIGTASSQIMTDVHTISGQLSSDIHTISGQLSSDIRSLSASLQAQINLLGGSSVSYETQIADLSATLETSIRNLSSSLQAQINAVSAGGGTTITTTAGTWTPTLRFGNTTTGISYSTNGRLGGFNRVGSMVQAWCQIILAGVGATKTGTANISGLPYNIDAGGAFYVPGSVGKTRSIRLGTAGGSWVVGAMGQSGTDEIELAYYDNRDGGHIWISTQFTNSTTLAVNLLYRRLP